MGFFSNLTLSEGEARALAKEVCKERGWTFVEPISITKGFFSWMIMTNTHGIGANARIKVSRKDKKVTHASYISR